MTLIMLILGSLSHHTYLMYMACVIILIRVVYPISPNVYVCDMNMTLISLILIFYQSIILSVVVYMYDMYMILIIIYPIILGGVYNTYCLVLLTTVWVEFICSVTTIILSITNL